MYMYLSIIDRYNSLQETGPFFPVLNNRQARDPTNPNKLLTRYISIDTMDVLWTFEGLTGTMNLYKKTLATIEQRLRSPDVLPLVLQQPEEDDEYHEFRSSFALDDDGKYIDIAKDLMSLDCKLVRDVGYFAVVDVREYGYDYTAEIERNADFLQKTRVVRFFIGECILVVCDKVAFEIAVYNYVCGMHLQ